MLPYSSSMALSLASDDLALAVVVVVVVVVVDGCDDFSGVFAAGDSGEMSVSCCCERSRGESFLLMLVLLLVEMVE
jgi:hypothetical protein